MTVVASASTNITNLDATNPTIVATSGEGSPGFEKTADDYLSTTAAQMASAGSTLRLCRFPATAKIKQVLVNVGGVDTNATATAVLDLNVAWSDATNDGTPTPLQGTIPTTALDGTHTTVAAYSSPNIMFSQVHASNAGAAIVQKDVTFLGTFTAAFAQKPMWSVLGMKNNAGAAQNPGGFLDLLVYLSTGAATGGAAVVSAMIRYVP